ncbi:MAG: 4Fe-4S cluster-binding domain-containing protein, partial [Patescibacteria group bacterium]|nr:4Fe-4S cluster-binding domain-containing protein [Patescibacteria group bacterium]
GKEILKYIDVLIDGPFIEKEKANLIWRGSKNQKVHFLTKKYLYLKPLIENENTQAELQIFNGSLVLTGFFELDFWKKLKHNLKTL